MPVLVMPTNVVLMEEIAKPAMEIVPVMHYVTLEGSAAKMYFVIEVHAYSISY